MKLASAALAATVVLSSIAGAARAELVYGVTLQQQLVTWDSNAPGTLLSGMAIQGLAANETVQGIDFRPATGEMYALGSFSRLYKINTTNGQASAVGSLATAINGSSFGVDFNPVPDRLRVTSDADQNLRINVDTLAVFTDGTLNYVAGDSGFGINPSIVGSAYTNNFKGATSTTLYNIDAARDALVIQNPPNAGGLVTVGFLGTDVTDLAGFDISGLSGKAFAAIRDVSLGRSTFWSVNLQTGQGTMIGEVGGGSLITAMTIALPTPGTAAIAGLALLAGTRRRR